jgi:hypothetical protein
LIPKEQKIANSGTTFKTARKELSGAENAFPQGERGLARNKSWLAV